MLVTTFSFTKILYKAYFLLCFLIKITPLNKEGNKSFHTPDASFCIGQNNNSNNCYHHSHNKIFCRWPERGKTFSHTKKKKIFCLRKQNNFWYVERNKWFSHLQYNFFHFFSPWLSVATAGRSTDRTTKLSEYATNTSSLCVDLRFNILCAVELLESIWNMYTFSVVEFLVLFCVWYWLFSDMNFFVFSFFNSHFLLFFSSVHKSSCSRAISLWH